MENVIIKAENIKKSYRMSKDKSVNVLKGISMQIRANRISVIVGASGAGKSTLLHIISGLDKPDEGIVTIDGERISAYPDDKLSDFRNKNIGFVFQFHHLLPEFTAGENIFIPMLIGGMSQKIAREKTESLLELVGLTGRSSHKPAELSGGEQQRVAVARALANDPQIIFADEPTGNLDSQNSKSIHELFLELRDRHKKTLIIVTHNPELMRLADDVYEIKDGLILL